MYVHLNMEATGQPWKLFLSNYHLEFFFETESLIESIKLADQ